MKSSTPYPLSYHPSQLSIYPSSFKLLLCWLRSLAAALQLEIYWIYIHQFERDVLNKLKELINTTAHHHSPDTVFSTKLE
ncbi:hypothetical protein C5471_06630 [Photorhabdus tasmaniensis]|uniref:Uncharacterized protein n=1 Tax=Photorhabdus tasmaniensis TaxID=1004159 RepID=A0ABX0GGM0_9GAMM|nr:hypothetical protein [Photorhabdus tasmaniensis]